MFGNWLLSMLLVLVISTTSTPSAGGRGTPPAGTTPGSAIQDKPGVPPGSLAATATLQGSYESDQHVDGNAGLLH